MRLEIVKIAKYLEMARELNWEEPNVEMQGDDVGHYHSYTMFKRNNHIFKVRRRWFLGPIVEISVSGTTVYANKWLPVASKQIKKDIQQSLLDINELSKEFELLQVKKTFKALKKSA